MATRAGRAVAVGNAGPVRTLPRESSQTAIAESPPGSTDHITLGMKRTGVRSAGNPHAAYDEAEARDGVKGRTETPEDRRKPPVKLSTELAMALVDTMSDWSYNMSTSHGG